MSRPLSARPAAPERSGRGAGRERILDEAAALFLARGFADTSMQQIADAAGVTKAALYYHFASKEELFAEVARRAVNEFWAGIIARIEAGGPLRDTLRAVVTFVAENLGEVSVSSVIDDLRRHLPPDTMLAILTEHPTPEAALERFFERAVAAGEMRPVSNTEAIASIFGAMTMGIVHRGHEHRTPSPEDIELLLDVFLNGVGAR